MTRRSFVNTRPFYYIFAIAKEMLPDLSDSEHFFNSTTEEEEHGH
jgi:hypothetical protein